MDTLKGNKLKVSKVDRALIEAFMGYADGYLSEWVTWNDIMPVVKKIGRLYDDFHLEKRPICDLTIFTPIDRVYTWVLDFIEWYNRHQPVNKK